MYYRVMIFLLVLFFASCKGKPLPNQEMIDLLKESAKADHNHENVFSPEAKIEYCDSILNTDPGEDVRVKTLEKKANALLQLGEEQKAIEIYQGLLDKISLGNLEQRQVIMKGMANAYLRWGDRTNCIHNHTAESCIFPIAGGGVYRDKTGAQKAIELYKSLLADDPNDLESRWLLNVAYMVTGGYPSEVPPQLLL